jgi:hypothetical protein
MDITPLGAFIAFVLVMTVVFLVCIVLKVHRSMTPPPGYWGQGRRPMGVTRTDKASPSDH